MSTTRDLLMARKNELVAQLPPLVEKFQKFRKALIEVEAEFKSLQKELETVEEALKKLQEPETSGPVTIMQAVLEVLNHKPQGMTALEILDEINATYFNGTILRTSLSPQLSRLKNRDKKIELRGNRWYRLPKEPSLFTSRV
jgi:predicted nuclease with TOPRIM domain